MKYLIMEKNLNSIKKTKHMRVMAFKIVSRL